MKPSVIILNALVATTFATSHAVSPNPDLTLSSPDLPTQYQSLLKESTSLISHRPWHRDSRSSPAHAISIRDAPDDNDQGYSSAYAEAQALGLVGGFRQTPTTSARRRTFNIAHGVLMALTFTLWLPLGAIIMHTTHRAYLHAAVQAFAYANAIAGMGLGVWLGRNVRYLDYAHTVIGMAVLAALVGQVALGVWTHWRVVAEREREREKDVSMPMPAVNRTGEVTGMRRIFTRGFAHRWLGRCLIALGIVNGGLGLKLAQNTSGGEIAYGIVAGLVGATYLSLLLIRSWRRYRMTKEEPVVSQGTMLT